MSRVLACEAALHQFIKTKYSALIEKIASTLNLDGDDEKTLVAAIEEFKKSWA